MAFDPKYQAALDKWKLDPKALNEELERTMGIVSSQGGKMNTSQQGHYQRLQELAAAHQKASPVGANLVDLPVQGATGQPKPSPEQIVATQSPSNPQFDIQAEIEKLKEAQKQQQFAALDKSRNSALSNIEGERSKVQPRYYQARNDAGVQSALGAQNFAEYMAQRGLRNSGENDQARLMQNVAIQGQMGALKAQEAQAYDDLDRRQTDTLNAYESDRVGIGAGIDAQALQNLINQRNLDRTFGLDLAGLTGAYNGQQTLASRNADRSYNLDVAGLTGLLNGAPTLAAQNQQFNHNFTQQQFAYQQARDMIADQLAKQQFDEDAKQYNLEYALNKQVQLGNLSARNAEIALSRERLNADQAVVGDADQAKEDAIGLIADLRQGKTTAYGATPDEVLTVVKALKDTGIVSDTYATMVSDAIKGIYPSVNQNSVVNPEKASQMDALIRNATSTITGKKMSSGGW